MEALTQEVRRLVEAGDEKTRKDVLDALHKLSVSIESPDDTVQRLTFYVRLPAFQTNTPNLRYKFPILIYTSLRTCNWPGFVSVLT